MCLLGESIIPWKCVHFNFGNAVFFIQVCKTGLNLLASADQCCMLAPIVFDTHVCWGECVLFQHFLVPVKVPAYDLPSIQIPDWITIVLNTCTDIIFPPCIASTVAGGLGRGMLAPGRPRLNALRQPNAGAHAAAGNTRAVVGRVRILCVSSISRKNGEETMTLVKHISNVRFPMHFGTLLS